MPIEYIVYYVILAIANIACWRQYKYLSWSDRMLAILLLVTFIEEAISSVLIKANKNNLILYHIYSPLEFFLTCLYFNGTIRSVKRNNAGIGIGIIGIICSVINSYYFQHVHEINSYFLLLEGTTIIIFCLLSFYEILLNDEHMPYIFSHFWINVLLIVYWSSTFTGWGIYATTYHHKFFINFLFTRLLEIVNYVFYIGLSLVFFYYKKLVSNAS